MPPSHRYYSTADGSYFKLPSQLKNVKWDSWTCRMGWPVQGIWPVQLSGRKREEAFAAAAAEGRTGIKAVMPEPTAVHRSKGLDLLAAAYQDGNIKVRASGDYCQVERGMGILQSSLVRPRLSGFFCR